jgi:hypothetical protein
MSKVLGLRRRAITVSTAILVLVALTPAYGAVIGIQGTMSNFDVFNETGVDVYGAEIELEGCHSADVMKTYPSRFNLVDQQEVPVGSTFGTRIRLTGFMLNPSTNPHNTNGHYAINLPGCEHFGFAVAAQPTVTRFFWLDQGLNRIGTAPLSIPNPTFTFVPAVQNNPPLVQAVVIPPPPEIPEPQLPDSIWMKVYVTELEQHAELEQLISHDDALPGPPSVVPQLATEVEIEWELLEGGVASPADMPIGDKVLSVVRRYEYYKYTGAYDPEDHAPLSTWTGVGDPPPDEIGDFIAANMVAVNFEVPEPSSAALLLGLSVVALLARRCGRS